MDIAHADSTSEFAGFLASKGSSGNLREVDLNETPSMLIRRFQPRLEALRITVAMGRHYFPLCSEVLDKLEEDDKSDVLFLEKGTPEEQGIKKKRFMELKEDVQKAFNKDNAENNQSGLSPSSSSSSPNEGVNYKVRKK